MTMVKKKKPTQPTTAKPSQDKPATLQDLLSSDVVAKLKQQSEAMKEADTKKKEEARKRAEEERKAEQKRLDNDFAYLLENSKDGNKYM
jgi:hypothetical protein